jgi:predicted HTH domain antitoxin
MAKTVSVAELGHGRASSTVWAAEDEPILVSRENRPAAWLVSAEKLARVAAAHGPEAARIYEQALALLAVDLYRQEVLTLGQGARLAGVQLSDFIDLCARLDVPILWEAGNGLEADVEAAGALATKRTAKGA